MPDRASKGVEMELKDLAGEHVLDAVDFDVGTSRHESCEIVRFRLDGETYSAVEDPEDGYRSCLGELLTEDVQLKNIFPKIRVVGRYQSDINNDVLELIDGETGKAVLEIGTRNCDDYYPYFVGDFYPENMATNKGKK